jgi:ABC-type phosphate transport system substrate-binding protein
MTMIMKHWVLLGMVFILTACGSPEESTPAPTPAAINILYPQALQAWANNLAKCASTLPQVALYFTTSDTLITDIQTNDIELVLGQPNSKGNQTYLSQIGWEQVVVVVNSENSLSQLSSEELRSIFSGQAIVMGNDTVQSYQVWVLPKADPTRLRFDQAILLNQTLTTDAMLAPDPGAMFEVISRNIGTIGYLPVSFLKTQDPSVAGKVKIVQLDPSLEAELNQPVIAMTSSEPLGLLRNLLVCLETSAP